MFLSPPPTDEGTSTTPFGITSKSTEFVTDGLTVDPIIVSIAVLVVLAVLIIAIIATISLGFYFSMRLNKQKVIGDFQNPCSNSPNDIVSSNSSQANLDSPCVVIKIQQNLTNGHFV